MERGVVLFVCVENGCRSVMAEAIFNADPPEGWVAHSAGTRPAAEVNPRTEPMLREIGLRLPPHPPTLLTVEMMDTASERVTLGCLDDAACPAHLKEHAVRDWALPDPTALDDADFRRVRDQIVDLVNILRSELPVSNRRSESPRCQPH